MPTPTPSPSAKPNFRNHWLTQYAYALLAVGTGFIVREGLLRLAGGSFPAYITFYPAVMLAALLGGIGPGLLATVIASLGVDYFILPPQGSLTVASLSDAVGLAFFSGMGVFMSVIAELYRRARQKAAGHDTELLLREGQKTTFHWSKQGFLLNAGLVASLAILTAAGWLAARNLRAVAVADKRETHSRVQLRELVELLSAMKDAETGQRGFLLTGEEKYLEPYQSALLVVQTNLAGLKQLNYDNAAQQQRLARIETLILEKIAQLKQTMELRRSKGLSAAVDVVKTDKGKNLMDQIRQQVADAQDDENRLVQERAAAKITEAGKALQALLAGGILAFLLLVTVFLFLKQENVRRTKAEADLRHHRDHLKEMVAARTEELSQQREWLHVTINSIGDAVLATDTAGQITFLNPVAESLTGWPEKEALGQPAQSVFRIINEQTHAAGEDIIARVLREGRIIALANHTALVARDGSEIPIEDSAAPIKDSSGTVTGVVLVFHDVTQKRRAFEALGRLAAIVESSDDAILSKDLNGSIASWNQGANLMFGYRPEEVIGRSIKLLLPPDRQNEEDQIMARLLAGERVHHFETVRVAKDGHSLAVSVTISPLKDGAGRIMGASKIVHDITKRKQNEEQLRLLSTAVESAVNGIAITDRTGQILWVNPAFSQLTGYNRAEVVGLTPRVLKSGLHSPEFYREMWTTLLNGQPWHGELVNRYKDGSLHDEEMTITPVRAGGSEITHFVAIKQDITERKRDQAALQQTSEEVKRSNRDLEQFAYIASHDLQEPLRAVGGYVKLLQRRFPENLDEKAVEYINGAVEGAVRMERLITDLLAFSRVGTHGGVFAPADLDAILNEALHNLQTSINSTETKVTRDVLPTLAVDATQMMQVFQNLIGNAIKFRGERPPEIHVGVQKQPDRWVFSVRDNGMGIEPQYFERIFQIFQRLHTRKYYPGTGIGLAICKKMVERHNGSIWVESQPGEGSTFFFSLPDTSAIKQSNL